VDVSTFKFALKCVKMGSTALTRKQNWPRTAYFH